MNLEKLKDTARKLEQKEDWRKAIEVYLKAIQQSESGAETSPDLSLYNRVGDLYLKINDAGEAVRSYERAVDLYADQGFFNNAIALCGKILRVNPGRTQTYLKLCQLHARKNVVSEAKRNLIEFLERMNALGQLDQAFQAVKLFADQFSGSQEIRSMLVDLLRATSRGDEAREQLEKMAHDLEASGDKTGARKTRERLQGIAPEHQPPPAKPEVPSTKRGDLVFLDTGIDLSTTAPPSFPPIRSKETPRLSREPPPAPPPEPEPIQLQDPMEIAPPAASAAPVDDLIIDPLLGGQVTGMGADSLLGFDPAAAQEDDSSTEPLPDLTAPLGLIRDEPTSVSMDFEPMSLEGMESSTIPGFSSGSASDVELPDDLLISLPPTDLDSRDPSVLDVKPDLGADALLGAIPDPQALAASSSVADLENRILDDPENPDIHLALAEKLITQGEDSRVIEELELALAGFEDRQDWTKAAKMAERLVTLSPDNITHHQKRVELAYRTGDRGPLLEAYLGLGDALARSGALDKAAAVYGRVIEHDPGNTRAASALARLRGTTAPDKPKPGSETAPPSSPSPAGRSQKAAPPPPPAPRSVAPPRAPTPQPRPQKAAVSNDDFIDLGSMLREEESRPRDTRMRVNRREPQDQDEHREFHEILEQFKRGIDENLDSDDYQSHYDLGVAFKEMGLLDEAIGEFQKALRATEGRLRTAEALGMAFFEKGQHAACEAVLRKAVESLEEGDEAKIGLLYWLGRALEAQGKEPDAIRTYERAMVVDIRFKDLSQRMQKLGGGRRR